MASLQFVVFVLMAIILSSTIGQEISRKTTEDIATMANDIESQYTCKKPVRLFSSCNFDSNPMMEVQKDNTGMTTVHLEKEKHQVKGIAISENCVVNVYQHAFKNGVTAFGAGSKNAGLLIKGPKRLVSGVLEKGPFLCHIKLGSLSDMLFDPNNDNNFTLFRDVAMKTLVFQGQMLKMVRNILKQNKLLLFYNAIHYRLNEMDRIAFGEGENQVLEKHFNDIKTILSMNKINFKTIYIAGGNIENIESFQKYFNNYTIVTKYNFLTSDNLKYINAVPARSSVFDFLISLHSSLFIGFSKSTFSAMLYLNHMKNGKKCYFYDNKTPPWQILLNVDPTFQYFQKKPKNMKEILEYDMKASVGIF
eukprot:g7210.t1